MGWHCAAVRYDPCLPVFFCVIALAVDGIRWLYDQSTRRTERRAVPINNFWPRMAPLGPRGPSHSIEHSGGSDRY